MDEENYGTVKIVHLDAEDLKTQNLNKLRKFLDEHNFVLTGHIIYEIYRKEKSFWKSIFSTAISRQVFVYDDIIIIKIKSQYLNEIEMLMYDFAAKTRLRIKIEVFHGENV